MISFCPECKSILRPKKEGDKVRAGEAVAIIGETGEYSSGPHLHFEMWRNGVAINPEIFFSFE